MDSLLTTLAIFGVVVGLYFLPTIIALDRKVPSKWSVVVINALLGWTLVGWVVALAMAVRDKPSVADQHGTVGQRVDV